MRQLEHSWNRAISVVLAIALIISGTPLAALPADAPAQPAAADAGAPGPAPGDATPEELEQLVSPIALYPDLLLARILVASTFPTQVVEAERWLKENPNLKGDDFAKAINAQPWDPSIRSLSQFPDVIKTMNDSLAWTSELGEAYYNQPDDVMNAIQRLRDRAMKAGTLKDTPQQKVETQPVTVQEEGSPQQIVVIQPAQQNTVYVPQYDPSSVYGAPVAAPAGYAAPAPAAGYTGTEMLTTGLLSFGLGMGLMALINEGDDDWDCGWDGSGGNNVNYNKNVYVNRGDNYAKRQGNRQGRQQTRQGRREGRNPRPTPYSGRGTRNPSSRPYNPANAKPYRPGGAGTPNFPKANTLPANARMQGGLAGQNGPGAGALGNRPGGSGNRPGGAGGGPGQGFGRGQNQGLRGYGAKAPDRATRGGRSGAFGGYGAGGVTQAAGNRGRSSLGGGRGGGGGGRRGGGGGGGRRGGGGGGGRGRR
jgi:hypothetical protein